MNSQQGHFDEWLDIVDRHWLAKYLGVTLATIRFWRSRHCFPRVNQMRRIKKITKGYVDYSDMIDRRLVTPKKASSKKRR